ncbi:MAG: anaerobic C4-dicarboxylate transporter [Oligoflexales bacterium]|nr:anaerobic C4-dicarboxylate transporter [Oligoflexales bacterium]
MLVFGLEFIILFAAILLGIRKGGMALGLIGGLGLAVFTFCFREVPSTPPIDVMLIILAVVSASATLQVAGGLEFLVQITERILRTHPQYVTILAPLSTFFLTVCMGTGHAVYTLLPVIADVALRAGVRPERPMAISSVAAQMGITASPVAAAVTTFLAFAAKSGFVLTPFDILKVTFPAGLIGVLAAAIWSFHRGKDLDKDEEFQEKLKDPEFKESLQTSVTTLDQNISFSAKISLLLFFIGVLTIIMLGLFPQFLPLANGKTLPMTTVVQIVMLTIGSFILFASGVKAKDIANSSIFNAGMVALVSIFGIAWMSDTFVNANKDFLIEKIGEMVKFAPWSFGIAMFCVSAFVKSQAATLIIMLPFGLALGLPLSLLLGLLPASYAYFFFAFYPSDLAAINMDRTGTTKIGSYLLNHSFMVPGLIGVGVSTTVAYFIAKALY